ncbi:putative Major facilitator superfamily (MFS) profile domain-containing protein [Seiridium cardinale]
MGFLYITASAALPPWFSTKRSLAVGISTAGAGIGVVIYNLATNSAIENVGLPWAYRILALCTVVANFVSALLLKAINHPREDRSKQEVGFRIQDFARIEVLLVVFWGTATERGYITLLNSMPSYASSVGLSSTQGSVANALLNIGLGLERPLLGYFSDRLGDINMALSMTALLCGTFWATAATPILVEVVGLSRMTRVFGVICLGMVFPTTFAEPVAMQIVDSQKTTARIFLSAQIFVGCMFMAWSISLWFLRAWKIAELEIEAPFDGLNLGCSISRLTETKRRHVFCWMTLNTMIELKRV